MRSIPCIYLKNTVFILRVKHQYVLWTQVLPLRLQLSWFLRLLYAGTKSKCNSVQGAECCLFGDYMNDTSFQSITKYLFKFSLGLGKHQSKYAQRVFRSFSFATSPISSLIHKIWRLKFSKLVPSRGTRSHKWAFRKIICGFIVLQKCQLKAPLEISSKQN